MIIYIIYFLFTPILWVLIVVSSLFQYKIRANYFYFYKILRITKKYIKRYNNNKKILLFHAASSGEYEQLKPLLRLIDKNHLAFKYSRVIVKRPILSLDVVENGIPKIVQMVLKRNGEWDGKVHL